MAPLWSRSTATVDPSADGSLVLASASPRRRMLLEAIGWHVVVQPGEADETPQPGESPEGMVRRLAAAKARGAAAAASGLVLGADTIVLDGEQILGKPSDADEARRMLSSLANRSHRVLTGLALLDGARDQCVLDACETVVPMRPYSDHEIEAYIASGGPFDKAGGYGIQDGGFSPVAVERLTGCFANVMGLPLCHLARALRRLGMGTPVPVPAACRQHTGYPCRLYPSILGGDA